MRIVVLAFLCLSSFLTAINAYGILYAEPGGKVQRAGQNTKTLPGEECRVDSLETWTPPEKWAWEKICEGKDADLDEYQKKFRDDKRRILSSDFLRTILLYEPFRSAIQHRGVIIKEAHFREEINIQHAIIERPLKIENSVFEKDVLMDNLRSPEVVYFTGSEFKGKLTMNSASIGSNLFMNKAEFSEVELIAAKIKGHIQLDCSKFKDKLDMRSISTGASIFTPGAEFSEVYMPAAKIEGHLKLNCSKFKDKLDMSFASIGGSLGMAGAEFSEVYMPAAKIEGHLELNRSKFKDKLDMRSISVGSDLYAEGTEFFKDLDLSDSRIKGKLSFGKSNSKIYNCYPFKMNLQNTIVDVLEYTKDTWPDNSKPEFEGFIYNSLSGFDLSADGEALKWFKEWLKLDETYSPQPYKHLANILITSGHESMANNILYENRERKVEEYKRSEPVWWYLKEAALKLTIGYGYRYKHAIYCTVGLLVLGWFLLWRWENKERDKNKEKLGFWYSLDMLLPIIHLREAHYEEDLSIEWIRWYFYAHKILGYALALFLTAGLTGLIK